MERSSGILLPISALPSPYGIGTLGKAARDFVDFLAEAGQTWWQILPVGPTDIGNSPYQSPSAFAGNPYLLDLDALIEDGLLTQKEVTAFAWGDDPAKVDYELLREHRLLLLRKAAGRFHKNGRNDAASSAAEHVNRFAPEDVASFEAENAHWLEDYALFMSLKQKFDNLPWNKWPDEAICLHQPEAIEKYRTELAGEMQFQIFLQYLFFKQWKELRAYAQEKDVHIMGDLALYVSLDSADVWAGPENFLLDEKRMPREVAGVPPDYFSKDGQLWGNPLYDYAAMERDGFGWWIRRIGGAEKLYDAIRIDHFRGLESFWAVPAGEKTARNGHWVKGPGMDLIGVLKNWFPNLQFIAEDLGILTPEVRQLRAASGFPGMKVLEFAFSPDEESDYLPHLYEPDCVCYAGTHDNDTLLGWEKGASTAELAKAKAYLGLSDEEGFVWGMLRGGMSSVASLFVAQMQDYLELGSDARMNTPGTIEGNWRWRLLPGQASQDLARRIAAITELYGRSRHSANTD